MSKEPTKLKTALIVLAIIGVIAAFIVAAMNLPEEYRPQKPPYS